jgi:hypothetical protein
MSNSEGQEKIQTLDEAKSSVTGVAESSFSSLAKMLGLPQLKESFYQNIVYIFMVIVIMIGILVYIQMVVGDNNSTITNNPLFTPPTKEVKKVEIKRIVEGFSINETMDISNSAADVNSGGDDATGHQDNNHLHNALIEHIEHIEDKKRK